MPSTNPAAGEITGFIVPLLMISYIVGLGLILWILRNILIMRQTPEIPVMRNATSENIPKPENFKATDAALRGLKFTPLGVRHSQASYSETGDFFWLYATPDGQILAEVVYTDEPPQPVAFVTTFADDAMLMTAYSQGANITTPDFSSYFEEASLEATLTYHRQQVAAWTKPHGEPKRINQLEDTYAITELYLKRYFGLFFRRRIFSSAVTIIILLLMMAFSLFTFVLPAL